jgi:hypothetical protein
VKKLALSLGKSENEGNTCETTEHFFTYHVLSLWEAFLSKIEQEREKAKQTGKGKTDGTLTRFLFSFSFSPFFFVCRSFFKFLCHLCVIRMPRCNEVEMDVESSQYAGQVSTLFPFNAFFADAQPLFPGHGLEADMVIAEGT